jgi:hypothetical protein
MNALPPLGRSRVGLINPEVVSAENKLRIDALKKQSANTEAKEAEKEELQYPGITALKMESKRAFEEAILLESDAQKLMYDEGKKEEGESMIKIAEKKREVWLTAERAIKALKKEVDTKREQNRIAKEHEDDSTLFKPGPSLTIDGIRCELLGRSKDDANYPIVIYKCGDTMFCAYKSNSEGLWRLNYIEYFTSMTKKEKGCDYITTTQLHMSLQCFINELFDTLPFFEFKNKVIQKVFYSLDKDVTIRQLIHNEIVSCDKEFKHPVFEAMTRICDFCFNNTLTFKRIFHHMEKQRRDLLPQNEYTAFLNDLLRVDEYDNAEHFYSSLVKVFSTYMDHFFSVDPDPAQFVCHFKMGLSVDIPAEDAMPYPNNVENSFSFKAKYFPPLMSTKNTRENIELGKSSGTATLQMKLNIFKSRIALKSSGQQFYMYYSTYTLPEKEADGIRENPYYSPEVYKAILNIVPLESKMNFMGLNDTYIRGGLYIYKIFDYANPAKSRQISRAKKGYTKLYNRTYQFAGDLLTHLWPLNEIHEEEAPKPESSYILVKAGGKHTKKRKASNRKRTVKNAE